MEASLEESEKSLQEYTDKNTVRRKELYARQQAEALARALAAEDLSQYGKEHRRIARRPAFMSDFMLLLDGHDRLRTRVLKAFAAQPKLFGRMLNAHLGELPPGALASNTLALGWRMLQV